MTFFHWFLELIGTQKYCFKTYVTVFIKRELLHSRDQDSYWQINTVPSCGTEEVLCPTGCRLVCAQLLLPCLGSDNAAFTCNYLSTHQLTKDSLLHRHTIIFKPEKIIIISQFHLILCPYSDFPNFLKIAVFSLNQNPKFMNCISVSPPENFSLLIFEIISNLEKNGKNNAKNPWLSLT